LFLQKKGGKKEKHLCQSTGAEAIIHTVLEFGETDLRG